MGFLARRIVFYLVAFFVAITVNFTLPRMMPGDPFEIMFAAAQGKMPAEIMPALKAQYGFVDGPWYIQYAAYIKSIFTWDLGPSILLFPTPVTQVLNYALPWTLFIAGISALISITTGTVMGVYAAYHRGGLVRFVSLPDVSGDGSFSGRGRLHAVVLYLRPDSGMVSGGLRL